MRLAIGAGLLFAGCPADPCFEGEPTFGNIQSKIFDRSCNNFSTCHNSQAGISVGDLNLCGSGSTGRDCDDDETSPYDRLVDVQASCEVGSRSCDDPVCDPEDIDRPILVIPGDAEHSYLYMRVSGDGLGADCVHRMPYGSSGGLCAEGVEAIRTWIEDGALP